MVENSHSDGQIIVRLTTDTGLYIDVKITEEDVEQYPDHPPSDAALLVLADKLDAAGYIEEAKRFREGVSAEARINLLPSLIPEYIRIKLDSLFSRFSENGWYAQQHFEDCQGCGFRRAEQECEGKPIVFYHWQDTESMVESSDWSLYLAYRGDPHELIKMIVAEGIDYEWDGSDEKRIKIIL